MAHQCERPACAEPAAVAYSFDPARGVAWLEPFVATDPHHGRLCQRHADAMVVPQGWWLEDRRTAEQLFASPPPPADGRAVRRPWRSSRPPAEVVALPLPVDGPPVDVEPADVEPAAGAVATLSAGPGWSPTFAADDDLGGMLNATSPLLSRAFGRVKAAGTRAQPPAQGA